MELSNDFSSLLHGLPSAACLVLISCEKATQKTGGAFNFDIAYSEYKIFQNSDKTLIQNIPRDVFMKIFIDLIQKGFLRSDAEYSKIYLGVRNISEKLKQVQMSNFTVFNYASKKDNFSG